MKVKVSSFATLAICLLFLTSGAFAGNIPVANGNFDTLPGGSWQVCDGTGCYNYSLGIPSWSTTGSVGQWLPPSGSGQLQPYPGDSYIAWTNGNGGTIFQNVAVVIAGDTYTLQVEIGTRTDVPATGVAQLTLNGTPVATATGTYASPGNWSTFTAHFTATSGEAGDNLGILLSATGVQGDFDDVRLFVPERSNLALFLGFGIFNLAAVFGFRRKLI